MTTERGTLVFVPYAGAAKSAVRSCSVDGCGDCVYANAKRSGLCKKHYTSARVAQARMDIREHAARCSVPNCSRPVYAKARVRGCCRRHYRAMYAAHPHARLDLILHDYTSASSLASVPSTASEEDGIDDGPDSFAPVESSANLIGGSFNG